MHYFFGPRYLSDTRYKEIRGVIVEPFVVLGDVRGYMRRELVPKPPVPSRAKLDEVPQAANSAPRNFEFGTQTSQVVKPTDSC